MKNLKSPLSHKPVDSKNTPRPYMHDDGTGKRQEGYFKREDVVRSIKPDPVKPEKNYTRSKR